VNVVQSPRPPLAAVLGPPTYDEVEVVRTALSGTTGTLVDVGAHGGSSLLGFARDGWQVWAFEPDEKNRARLARRVADLPLVHIDDRAVSHTDGERLPLFTSDVSTGISALTPFHPSHRATATVETVRLDTFLAGHGIDEVTVLKTDTEGYDLAVLESFPWQRTRPRVVVCEFEDRKTEPLGYLFGDLGDFLTEKGYQVLVSEWRPVVEYGMRHRWRGVRRYPSRLEDPHAWGNFIAVDADLADRVLNEARRAGRRLRLRLAAERVPAIARRL
jgi:FkbM family methyltransferase